MSTLATHERRCDCCSEGPGGLGFWHFDTLAQLRCWLDDPGREEGIDIDVADIPGIPFAMAFVSAGEAAAWLAEYDEQMAEELAMERELERRAERVGAKL